jgi:hypothetical protein
MFERARTLLVDVSQTELASPNSSPKECNHCSIKDKDFLSNRQVPFVKTYWSDEMLPRFARTANSQALKSTTSGGHVSCQSALKVSGSSPHLHRLYASHKNFYVRRT